VAYHGGALCIDHVSPHTPELASIRRRFAVFDDLLARTLRALGVAAAVGEVPGEYCPGEFSVNDGRGHKLVGTAQRLVPRTWLFSAVILISDPDPLRAVLEAVYAELELDWDPGDSWCRRPLGSRPDREPRSHGAAGRVRRERRTGTGGDARLGHRTRPFPCRPASGAAELTGPRPGVGNRRPRR